MVIFRSSSPHPNNPPQKDLELANALLESARKTEDSEVALVICSDAEDKLSRVKRATKKTLLRPTNDEDETLRKGVASAFIELGKLLGSLGQGDKALVNYKRAEKLG
jgi:hypothetical protein